MFYNIHGQLTKETPGYLQKQPCHRLEETAVYNSCVLPAMTFGAETWTLTKQAQTNFLPHRPTWYEVCSPSSHKNRSPTYGLGREQKYRHNQQCEKNEVVLGRAYRPRQRRPMDLTCHHLETIDKRRQQ